LVIWDFGFGIKDSRNPKSQIRNPKSGLRVSGIFLMHDSSRFLGMDQEIERIREDLFMKLGNSGATQGLTKPESDGVKSPRGPGLPALLRVHGDQHGGYPLHFDGSLQRDDRPVAERSTCG